MSLHEVLGLDPETYMRFCEQVILVLVLIALGVFGMIMAYAKGRVDEQKRISMDILNKLSQAAEDAGGADKDERGKG